jgi:hypothetical protein
MHVAPIRIEVDDRVSDHLAGAVIRHVAAAAGFEYLDAPRRELIRRGDDVRPAVLLDADRDHVRMLQQQQGVGDAVGFAILDERALQVERVGVGNETEPPHLERVHRAIRPATDRNSRCPS